MIKWFTLSTIIHALILVPWVTQKIVVPRAEPGVSKPKTLVVSLMQPKPGIVKGFPGSVGEQSDTFLPDDTCAWSPPNGVIYDDDD